MFTTRRFAPLALLAAAGLALAACSSDVDGAAEAAQSAVEQAVDSAVPTASDASEQDTSQEDTSGGVGGLGGVDTADLPIPGEGLSGDAGLCTAVAGWYGYAALAVYAGEDTDIDALLGLLGQLEDAPEQYEDATSDLLDLAAEVSQATATAINDIESGDDPVAAVDGITESITEFGEGCSSIGVDV